VIQVIGTQGKKDHLEPERLVTHCECGLHRRLMEDPHHLAEEAQVVLSGAYLLFLNAETGNKAVEPHPPGIAGSVASEEPRRLDPVEEEVHPVGRVGCGRRGAGRRADHDLDRIGAGVEPHADEVGNGPTDAGK